MRLLYRPPLGVQLLSKQPDVGPALGDRQIHYLAVPPVQVVGEVEDLASQAVLLPYEATKKFDISSAASYSRPQLSHSTVRRSLMPGPPLFTLFTPATWTTP